MDDWWGEGRCNEGFDGPTRCQATMQKLTRRNETRTQPKPGRIWINNTKQPVGGSRVGNGKKGGVRKIGARKYFLSLPDAKTFYQIEIINEKNSVSSRLLFWLHVSPFPHPTFFNLPLGITFFPSHIFYHVYLNGYTSCASDHRHAEKW